MRREDHAYPHHVETLLRRVKSRAFLGFIILGTIGMLGAFHGQLEWYYQLAIVAFGLLMIYSWRQTQLIPDGNVVYEPNRFTFHLAGEPQIIEYAEIERIQIPFSWYFDNAITFVMRSGERRRLQAGVHRFDYCLDQIARVRPDLVKATPGFHQFRNRAVLLSQSMDRSVKMEKLLVHNWRMLFLQGAVAGVVATLAFWTVGASLWTDLPITLLLKMFTSTMLVWVYASFLSGNFLYALGEAIIRRRTAKRLTDDPGHLKRDMEAEEQLRKKLISFRAVIACLAMILYVIVFTAIVSKLSLQKAPDTTVSMTVDHEP